ncbi:MAG: hypothetical protein BM556_17920 [Bacteriovorax sp. MedPE-SWde]|nr:MAG: hypothetical protein BM556_17920 [Bacteriovorax sp. MedPE-SWde]
MNYKKIYASIIVGLCFVMSAHATEVQSYKEIINKLEVIDLYLLKQGRSYKANFNFLKNIYDTETVDRIIAHTENSDEYLLSRGDFRHINLGKTFQRLKEAMLTQEVEALNMTLLMRAAKEKYNNLQRDHEIGGMFTMCYQSGAGSRFVNTCEVVELSIDIYLELTSNFSDYDHLSAEARELSELNALKVATGILEENTFYKNDKAGWFGNLRKSMKDGKVLTRCGNETFTYNYFVNDLADSGLLKSVMLSRGYAALRAESFGREHQASIIIGIKSRQEYILDSWLEKGGEMAHILKIQDWKKKKKNDVVPGISGWTP